MSLIDTLIEQGWLKTPAIINAFSKIKRADFLPEDMKDLADEDVALAIEYGQTNSQPLTVAFMLELLQPKSGDKILDVGSGSGWTTALLSEIASAAGSAALPAGHIGERQGKVIAVEIVPELSEWGKNNASKYGFVDKGIAQFICADGSDGYEKEAPYDKILISASGAEISEKLKKQLKEGGRIVAPVKNSIWILTRESEDKFTEKEYPGFVFVPLL
jgi:protein-L-isoaspartate(D-aspartate) O-methyltransferase